ncbi:MAG TPA: D-glucuronyl C5-epimerase family protein [Solirubrobacteraceae bacterium]
MFAIAAATPAAATKPSRFGVYQLMGTAPRTWQTPYELVEGIPLVNYETFVAFNPVTTAQYGLANYSLWIAYGERSRLEAAETAGRWLIHREEPNGGLPYGFPWTPAGSTETLAPGWMSALAQGQTVSLLERLYHHSHEAIYRHGIQQALRPLSTLGSRGLERHYLGGTYFEEYPTKTVNFSMNGDAQTLLGLYDIANLFPVAEKLFKEGARTLAHDLPMFDSGKGYSLYSIAWPYHPPPGYDPLIQDELRLLGAITGNHVFDHYAALWFEP